MYNNNRQLRYNHYYDYNIYANVELHKRNVNINCNKKSVRVNNVILITTDWMCLLRKSTRMPAIQVSTLVAVLVAKWASHRAMTFTCVSIIELPAQIGSGWSCIQVNTSNAVKSGHWLLKTAPLLKFTKEWTTSKHLSSRYQRKDHY